MLARIPLLLAHFALLGCGINNNCGKFNPFGCAKGDESGGVEVTSMVSETTSTTPTSTSNVATTTTDPSTGSTVPVDPTTSTMATSPTTVDTTMSDTTTTESSTLDTTDSMTETTSTTAPGCGDGTVDDGEECDDGNKTPDDGCDNECVAVHRLVFISSALYKGDLGGLEGADNKCRDLAKAIYPTKTFKAWLSTGTESAANRIGSGFTGLYVLSKDDIKVANGWAGLTEKELLHAINVDEKGTIIGAPQAGEAVWTNTAADGEAGTVDCMEWTSLAIGPKGKTGISSETMATWTSNADLSCGASGHLYCFEVPK